MLTRRTLLTSGAALASSRAEALNITLLGSGPLPIFLPTVATAPYAVYATKKIVAGYTGACCDVVRASDSATATIGFTPSGSMNFASALAFQGTSTLKVSKWYDQSGGGRDLAQATSANQPNLFVTTSYAKVSFGATPTNAKNSLFRTTGISLSNQNSSHFFVGAQNSAAVGAANNPATAWSTWWTLYNGTTTLFEELVTGPVDSATLKTLLNLATSAFNTYPLAQRSIVGYNVSGGTATLAIRGLSLTGATSAANTASAISLGDDLTTSGFQYWGDFEALVTYNASLSAGDRTTISNVLQNIFSIPSYGPKRVVMDGDSILAGRGCFGNQNLTKQMPLSGNPEVINFGVGGETLATMFANRNRSTCFANGPTPTTTIAVIQGGTNDIAAGTSAASLETTATSYLSALRTFGYTKCARCTILQDGVYLGVPAKENERLSYNAGVLTNSAGWDFVIDVASNSIMGAAGATNDTTLYSDTEHPTALGQYYLATLSYIPALNAQL